MTGDVRGKVTMQDEKSILTVELEELPTTRIHDRPRPGDMCLVCGVDFLDYDGLLNLSCPSCGATASGGCFT